jgi:dual-specificity kinase
MKLRSSRRRPRAPDWDAFYKNGLPQEVIVIEDTPEPTTKKPRNHTADDHTQNGNGHSAKKRKIEDSASNNTYSSNQYNNSSGSGSRGTREGDTLPAGSRSDVYRGDDSPVRTGQKRKRTGQQASATASKARKVTIGKGFHDEYRGPGRRVTKAGEVAVRVFRDVRNIPNTALVSRLSMSNMIAGYT